MNTLSNWGAMFAYSFQGVWDKIIAIAPNLLGAIIVFLLGLAVAEAVGRIIAKVLQKMYLDQAVEKAGLKYALEKIGFRLGISRALGLMVTWFLYLVVLIVITEILNLDQISLFLQAVVLYIPNVIIAIFILIIGIIVGNFIFILVKEASLAAKLEAADFLAALAKWAIIVFSVMAALVQLRVATELIQILFTGVVFMFALAGGLAFGLGGKDKAKELIDKLGSK